MVILEITSFAEMPFSSYKMQIVELLQEAYKEEFPNSKFQKEFFLKKINQLEYYLINDKQTLLLASVDEDRVCGFLHAFCTELRGQKSLHINQIFTHHSYRRQKIAQSLLDFLEQYAFKMGIKQLDLETKPYLQGSIELYIKNGFKLDTLIFKKTIAKCTTGGGGIKF